MNTFKKCFLLAFAILALSLSAFGQATMSSTTLSSNVGSTDQCVYVASATGITAAGSLNQPTTGLFIDEEYMTVTTVTGTQVCVSRIAGSVNRPHASGAVLWFGPPNYFGNQDPSGSCTASSLVVLPRIVIPTGRIWTCFYNGNGVSGTGVWAQEGYAYVSPANCGSKATTTTTTDNGMVPVATGNVVHQFSTSSTGGTTQFTCDLTPPQSRLTTGRGVFIGDVDFLYGAQTTAISSIAAATLKTVTYPASTSSGAAAAGTVAAAGGTYTVTPGTLQLTTTTTGQCFNEKLTLGTPIQVNTDNQKVTLDQVFTNSSTTVYQICGLLVHYYSTAPAF